MNLQDLLSYALDKLTSHGMDKAQGVISEGEKKELNIESGKISLFRTTFQNSLNLEAIKDCKQSSISINKTDKDSMDKAIETLIENVKSSEIDKANDISENQPEESFSKGNMDPNLDSMYDKLDSFNGYVKDKHPNIIMEAAILDHVSSKSIIMNSNGVNFKINKGNYNFSPMFTAKEGTKTSSFNYTYFSALELNHEIKNRGYVSELLRQSEEQLNTLPVGKKFVGQILVTPHCLSDFLSFIEYSIGDNALVSGASIYKDKVGKQVTDSRLTLSSLPVSSDLDCGYFVNSDAYKAENIDIIKDGILNTHLLSIYGANKTGGKRVSNDGGAHVIPKGSKSLNEMIRDIDQGVLLCRFSGGSPSDNGDFSGVAKNSYYIENGEIKFPIAETMISGNIAQMFMNIGDISNENVDFGSKILPWISFDGVTVS